MKPIVDLSRRARADMIQLRDYIAQDSARAAQRFYFAAEEAMETLAGVPEIGGRCDFPSSTATNLRVWSVPKFKNHLIFYRPIENGIEVVRVLHGARDLESLLDS